MIVNFRGTVEEYQAFTGRFSRKGLLSEKGIMKIKSRMVSLFLCLVRAVLSMGLPWGLRGMVRQGGILLRTI